MDQETFDAFYAASFGRLVGQIYAMCGNVTEAQDCVQEAFIRAWDRRGIFSKDRSPEAWVRTVAYRLAVSRWRKHRRQNGILPDDLAATALDSTNRVALHQALGQLPPQQRRAIVLFYLVDLSVSDVAAEMDVPAGTVKAWLSRGRTALASLLSDKEGTHA